MAAAGGPLAMLLGGFHRSPYVLSVSFFKCLKALSRFLKFNWSGCASSPDLP